MEPAFPKATQAIALTPDGPHVSALGIGTWAWGIPFSGTTAKGIPKPTCKRHLPQRSQLGLTFLTPLKCMG